MTEQEQHQTQQNQNGFALHPVFGAVPALIGVVLVLVHLRRPLLPAEDQSILMNVCLGLVGLSLAMWLHYGMERIVQRVVRHFNDRHDEMEREAERRHTEAQAAAAERHDEAMAEMHRLGRKADRLCNRLKMVDQKLVRIERQGVALGAAFIDEGVPGDHTRAA